VQPGDFCILSFMRLHRFYIKEKIDDPFGEAQGKQVIALSDYDLIHQMKNVFRFNVGTEVLLFDGSGFEYLAVIVLLKNNEAQFQVIEKRDKRVEDGREVTLYASLIKKDNFEWIIQKATELGVTRIVPIISERSEKKALNIERGIKILIEASEQSGRVTLPELQNPQALSDVIQGVTQGDKEVMNLISIDPEGKPWPTPGVGHPVFKKAVGIFIGPEGGWSDKELGMFKEVGIPIYNIGSQILRAETAAIAITALLLLGK
jgi:16S rRNA (uracil1498-N3)-methyltransferase